MTFSDFSWNEEVAGGLSGSLRGDPPPRIIKDIDVSTPILMTVNVDSDFGAVSASKEVPVDVEPLEPVLTGVEVLSCSPVTSFDTEILSMDLRLTGESLSIVSRDTLRTYFESGDKPTEVQFSDLIDSSIQSQDDTTILMTVQQECTISKSMDMSSPLLAQVVCSVGDGSEVSSEFEIPVATMAIPPAINGIEVTAPEQVQLNDDLTAECPYELLVDVENLTEEAAAGLVVECILRNGVGAVSGTQMSSIDLSSAPITGIVPISGVFSVEIDPDLIQDLGTENLVGEYYFRCELKDATMGSR